MGNVDGKTQTISCAGKLPPEISGHRIVCNDKYLYSFGGYSPKRGTDPMVKELWKFHCSRIEWTNIPLAGCVPKEVASSGVVLVDNHMVLVGGTGIPFGQNLNKKVYYCNLAETNADGAVVWKELDVRGKCPEARYGQAVAVHENHLYVVGGTDGTNYSIEVHRLDLQTSHWERLAGDSMDPLDEFPEIRYRAEIIIYEHEIFVFGGGTPNWAFDLRKIPVFNLSTRKWTRRPTLPDTHHGYPLARRCHSLVQSSCGNWAVIAGGIGQDGCLDDIWKLDLPQMKWTRLEQALPEKVFFHSSAISSGNRMYTFGGVLQSEERSNKLSVLDVTVTSLQDFCLQKLLKTTPSLFDADVHTLESIGIPRKHVRRIIP